MRDEGSPTSFAWPVAWASNELMSSLQAAYRWANTSDHMVHANRGPVLVDRRHPETDVKQESLLCAADYCGLTQRPPHVSDQSDNRDWPCLYLAAPMTMSSALTLLSLLQLDAA